MPEPFDLEKTLSRNPHINRDRLEEGRDLLRRLRNGGAQRKNYDLAPPFGGRRAAVRDDANTDSRRVRLRHWHSSDAESDSDR